MLIFVLTHSKGLLSNSIRRFQFVRGSPQKRFRDLVATLKCYCLFHMNICPYSYYMNVIPTNLKVRFVSKIRPQKWTNANAALDQLLTKQAPKMEIDWQSDLALMNYCADVQK